jgi:hypothetical protein
MLSSAEASMGVSDGPGRVVTALGLLTTQRCERRWAAASAAVEGSKKGTP